MLEHHSEQPSIESDTVPLDSLRVRYRLLRSTAHGASSYYISVCLGAERCTLMLPTQDEQRARALYRLIRDGLVTPCTLPDILSDLA